MARAGLDADIVAQAAARIIDSEGRAALTLARLAADLGVASPSLYKHIAGLDDLIGQVTTLSIRRLTETLTAAAVGRSGRHALLAVAEAYRRFAVTHPGLYALTQSAVNLNATAIQAEAARAVDVFRATISGYGLPDDLVIHAIRVVRAGLHGFADIEARGGFQMPLSVDASFLVLVDALDASLRNLGKRSRHGSAPT